MVIQHLDRSGNTVLFRRFNRRDWKHERYGFYWDEKLPESERLTINGDTFVHWYDCIPEMVL